MANGDAQSKRLKRIKIIYKSSFKRSFSHIGLAFFVCLFPIANRTVTAQMTDLVKVDQVLSDSERTFEVTEGFRLVARAQHPFDKDMAPYAGISSDSCNSTSCTDLLTDPFISEGYRVSLRVSFPSEYITKLDALTVFTTRRMFNLASHRYFGDDRRASHRRGYGRFRSTRLKNGFWMNTLDLRRLRGQAFTEQDMLHIKFYGSVPPIYAAAFKGHQEIKQSVCEPPQVPVGTGEGEQSGCHNSEQPCDVNGDGQISSLDALLISNALRGRTDSCPKSGSAPYLDLNGDGKISSEDTLYFTNNCTQPRR
jgi:hypothetical protein